MKDMNLQRSFHGRANSFERANNADAPIAVNQGATQLASSKGNPSFAAQFDISLDLCLQGLCVWAHPSARHLVAEERLVR